MFDRDTNEPDVSSIALVDALLLFSSSGYAADPLSILGSDYVGSFVSPVEMHITIVDSAGRTASLSQLSVGYVSVTLKEEGGLRSADLTSDIATSSAMLALGSWRDHTKPALVSLTAENHGGVMLLVSVQATYSYWNLISRQMHNVWGALLRKQTWMHSSPFCHP